MNGKAHTVHVENGDKVSKGQLLTDADLDMIIAAERKSFWKAWAARKILPSWITASPVCSWR